MLQKIKPHPKGSKFKGGSLTPSEKSLVKGLLSLGYRAQDITFIVNQGRSNTVNQARISQIEEDIKIVAALPDVVADYIKIQSSYDPKTLLNPYKDHRLIRAREAMISAVQSFNNPSTIFKAELFCVLANIAWTYLLHEKLEQTKTGSSKLANGESVTLSGTLNKAICPITAAPVVANLEKISEIRIEVEHTFFVGGEVCFGPLFQACCINFENHLTEWFGDHLSLTKDLSLALQFSQMTKDQIVSLESSKLPEKIKAINASLESSEFANDHAFQVKIFYSAEVSSKSSAEVSKLVSYEEGVQYPVVAIKKVHYTRLTQAQIVKKANDSGYKKFTKREHHKFWLQHWANAAERNKKAKEYGELLLKTQWMWFAETWLPIVLKYCKDNGDKFK